MADEVTVNAFISVVKDYLSFTKNIGSLSFDMDTARMAGGTQTIGTGAHEALEFNDIATPGYVWMRNLDATNYVEIGIDDEGTFEPTIVLKAGRIAMFPAAAQLYAQADTADVELEYYVAEEG